jgi:hypothetical protein
MHIILANYVLQALYYINAYKILAALAAILERSALVMVLRRRFPPI